MEVAATSGKCRACREKRRLVCVKAPGASKCTRCRELRYLCITPLTPGALEEAEVFLTVGECCRELTRPTGLYRTRLAVTQLLEILARKMVGGRLPEQVLGGLRMAMHRARASNDVALLHAAVSMCAALHVKDPMATLAPGSGGQLLVAEAEECILRRRELDGAVEGLPSVRQVLRGGTSHVTCNELFKSAFFDAANRDISALYMDLTVALVDDEGKDALAAMDEAFARVALFGTASRTPSGLCIVAVTSDEPVALVGGTGDALAATLRVDIAWAPCGSVAVTHLTLIDLVQRPIRLAQSDGDAPCASGRTLPEPHQATTTSPAKPVALHTRNKP